MAYEEGRYAQSADLMRRAQALYPAPVHLLYLGRAYAKLGKLVLARESLISLTRSDLPANAPKVLVDTVEDGRRELADLEPRIPTLTIRVTPEDAPELEVTMDGVLLPAAMVGMARPVDPGNHVVVAKAKAHAAIERSISLKEGATQTLELELVPAPHTEPLKPLAGGGATRTPGRAPGPAPSAVPMYAAFGVGAVGLGFGTWAALRWTGKRDDAEALYDDCYPSCTRAQKSKVDDLDGQGKTAGVLSWVGYGVGAAGVATGVALLLMNSSGQEESATGARPWVGVGSAGLSGRF